VAIISTAAFGLICNWPRTELFFLSLRKAPPSGAASYNHVGVAQEEDVDLSMIPEEYDDFVDLFSKRKVDEPPLHGPYNHKIALIPGSKPLCERVQRVSLAEGEEVGRYVAKNLKKGFICYSQSEYGAPIVFARKKDGTLRICIDYRGLNKLTIKNCYPLPLIGELLDCMLRGKVLSKFDIRDGYNRLRMVPSEEAKTSFCCRQGLFEYTVMPFRLCNAPGTFQHYMNDTFRDFLDKFVVIYLDDFLIFSDNLKEHKKHMQLVLQRMHEVGLYLKASKCEFHKEEVEFLGFIVGKDGIRMDPKKVD